jgi:hypothetical protein
VLANVGHSGYFTSSFLDNCLRFVLVNQNHSHLDDARYIFVRIRECFYLINKACLSLNQGSQTWLRSPMSGQGSRTWIISPMPERGDPYVWYEGRVWRYQRGGQMEKGQTSNYKMTNNDQHKSSPKSALRWP